MEKNLLRAYVVELVGTFALVYVGAGVVCVNHLTTPTGQQPATAAARGHACPGKSLDPARVLHHTHLRCTVSGHR